MSRAWGGHLRAVSVCASARAGWELADQRRPGFSRWLKCHYAIFYFYKFTFVLRKKTRRTTRPTQGTEGHPADTPCHRSFQTHPQGIELPP